MRFGPGRGARLASATVLAALAATFAFSVPAYAQEGPGPGTDDTPTESTDPGTETAPEDAEGTTEAGSSGEGSNPPAETAPATDPPAQESTPPPPDAETPAESSTEEPEPAAPAEPAPPSECAVSEEGAADGACEPAAPADDETDPAATPGADCDDATAPPAQPPAEGGEPAPACGAVSEPGPAAATAPAPAPPPAPAPAAEDTVTIVLIVGDDPDAAAAPVTAAPQNAELADLLRPLMGAAVTLSGGASDAVAVLAVLATIAGEQDGSPGSEQSFDAAWFESVVLSARHARGSCVPRAGEVMASGACAGSPVASVLTAGEQLWPTMDEATGLPKYVADELKRQRRTHPEARADAGRPVVAVAQAPARSDGRTRVSGGSTGGSAGSVSQRIFVVSTLPLALSAPVSFPTEPPPTLLPEGEPGIAPTASPG